MNYQHKIKPLLTTLSMCCAAPLSAADPEPSVEPVVWHVENAEPRVPPQVYIANPNPLDITGDLAG